jgi:putative membrane protein
LDLTLFDAVLAILHHLLAFGVAILLTMEIMATRRDMGNARIMYLSRIDIAYGATAGALFVIGLLRVFYGLRGPEYYASNEFFWAKMAAFAILAILSIRPTVAIARWRGAGRLRPDFRPDPSDVMAIRRMMHAEAMVFALIPVFAALMARYA